MKLDGQLEHTQLEEIASAAPTPAPRSRIYSDITTTSKPLPRYHDGNKFVALEMRKKAYSTQITTYTILVTDEILYFDGSSAGFTATLPPAANMTGECVELRKSDVSANVITIDGDGAEAIDGNATIALSVSGDWVKLLSLGTSWTILLDNRAKTSPTVTSTTSLLATYDTLFCDATSAGFTVNLMAAGSVSGKTFIVKKTDATFNAVTLDGNASETIDGSTTVTLNSKGEWVKILSTGTAWVVTDFGYYEGKTAYTPGSTWVENPNHHTITGFWWRSGNRINLEVHIALTGAPTTATLNVNLPSGPTIDTAQLTALVAGRTVFNGQCSCWDNSASQPMTGPVAYASTTAVTPMANNTNVSGVTFMQVVSESSPFTFATADTIDFTVTNIPISGWRG